MKTFLKLTFALFSMLFMATVVSNAQDVPVADVVSVMGTGSLILFAVRIVFLLRNPKDVRNMQSTGYAYGVAVEFWESTIAEFLMREYPWIMRAKDRTSNVIDNAIVHIPQAGALPGAVRNRKQYPAPIVRRSDSDITYVIDEISTNPSHIKDAEKVELSYDKVGSVLNDHIKQLNYLAAYNAMYRWAGKNPISGGVTNLDLNGANIVRTTSGTSSAAHLSGATGTRRNILVADVASAKTVLINQTKRELNTGKRALILDETMYNQLKSDTILNNNQQYDLVGAVFKDGDLIKLHGFDIIRTDVLPRFTNAATPLAKDPLSDADIAADGSLVPYQNTFATSDNSVALLVDFDYVHIAKGNIQVFETLRDATFQGDIYSALFRMGASRERLDQAGVAAIVQQP